MGALVALWGGTARPAGAGEPVVVEIAAGPGLPFTRGELAGALELRARQVAPDSPVVVVIDVSAEAVADGGDAVELRVAGRQRRVVLEGRRGDAAARLVALAAADLLLDSAVPALAPPSAALVVPAPIPVPVSLAAAARALGAARVLALWHREQPRPVTGYSLTVGPELGLGVEGRRWQGLGLRAAAPLGRFGLVGLDLGLANGVGEVREQRPTSERPERHHRLIMVRPQIGARLGMAELRVGLVAQRHRRTSCAGGRTVSGASAAVALRVPLWGPVVAARIDLGLDALGAGIQNDCDRRAGLDTLAWLGLGLELGAAR